MTKTIYALPDDVRSSYILNPERSFLSIVKPTAAVNLVFDPEARALGVGANNNYSDIGSAVVSATTTRRRRGIYGVEVDFVFAIGDGVVYPVASTTAANRTYAFSFDHYGPGRYSAYIQDRNTGLIVAQKQFDGQSFWTRQYVSMYQTNAIAPNVCVVANELVGTFWVDGFQFELDGPTTFISGELREEYIGRAQYGWLGSPHNSASFRLGTARSGGQAIPLSDFGFDVYEMMDWGLPKPEHILTPYASKNGVYYQRSRFAEREISFVGQLTGDNLKGLLCSRNALTSRMDPTGSRPFRMHFQAFDGDEPLTETVEFDALYSEGLEGEFKTVNEERASLTLTMPDPFFYAEGEDGAVVDMYDVITDTGIGVVGRDGNGVWQPLLGATAFPIADFVARGMVIGEDYNLYVVGHAALGDTSYVMRWDGVDWTQIGPTWVGKLRAIAYGFNKSLLFAGDVTRATGDPATPGFPLWRYDITNNSYGAVAGRYFNDVSANEGGIRAIAIHPDGMIIVGGAFTYFTDGTTPTPALNVAHYDIRNNFWAPMDAGLVPKSGGGGPDGAVNALAIGPDKSIWAGGDFDPNITNSPTLLARYHYATNVWNFVHDYPMSMDETSVRILGKIFALTFGRDGKLYIGGQFNTSRDRVEVWGDPLPLTHIARYTPPSYLGDDARTGTLEPLAHGVNFQRLVAPGVYRRLRVSSLAIDCDGILYVGGTFTYTRDLRLRPGGGGYGVSESAAPGIAAFNLNGSVWLRPETTLYMPDPATDLAGVLAMVAGGNCNQNRGSGVDGRSAAGNPILTDLGFAVPPGADNTIFAAAYMVIGSNIPIVDIIDTGCAIDTRPLIVFQGQGNLYAIENFTNGTAIEFDRVIMAGEETVFVDLSRPRPVAYRSSGNTYGIIKKGSGLGAFRLETGENRIKVTWLSLGDDHTNDSQRKVTMQWKPKYASIDALCGSC